MAPGNFTPAIFAQNYYIASVRNLDDNTSPIVSSLQSNAIVPLLIAVLVILLMELIAVKKFKIGALFTAIFRGFCVSFYQNFTYHSSWFCFIQVLILTFPLVIFNASFNTRTLVGNRDVKIDTLKDVIIYNKIPYFVEGISKYDFFKSKVNKEYAEIYRRSVQAGYGKPFPGNMPRLKRRDLLVTFVTETPKRLIAASTVKYSTLEHNQNYYFSARPFHSSLQAMLLNYNISKSASTKLHSL